jgi:hypothetical protein
MQIVQVRSDENIPSSMCNYVLILTGEKVKLFIDEDKLELLPSTVPTKEAKVPMTSLLKTTTTATTTKTTTTSTTTATTIMTTTTTTTTTTITTTTTTATATTTTTIAKSNSVLIINPIGATEAYDFSSGNTTKDTIKQPPDVLEEPEILRYGDGLLGCSTKVGENFFPINIFFFFFTVFYMVVEKQ